MRLVLLAALGLSLAACAPSPAPGAEAPPAPAAAQTSATPEAAAVPEAPLVPTISPSGPEDAHIMAAQDVAIAELQKREGPTAPVMAVEAKLQQLRDGAGMTYDFVIILYWGARYGVTVFRSPEGKLEVTKFAKQD